MIADSAADLYWNPHRSQYALDRRRVHRPAGESAIEIDDVEVGKALRRESARLFGRVPVKNRRARHVALFEAHRFTVFQINGRKEDHGFH